MCHSYTLMTGCIMVRFKFDESKTLEAIVYVATYWRGLTPFYLSKILFFADRNHLRAYGRPVTGDVYIAMVDGPVPSRAYDIVKGNLDLFGDPLAIELALSIEQSHGRYHIICAKRKPNTDLFSEADVAALDAAIKFCHGKSFGELSSLTHQEPACYQAPINTEMDPELLVPEDMREEVRETAAYAVL
jgi:hypothetical protein